MGYVNKVIVFIVFLLLIPIYVNAANDFNLDASLNWINKTVNERNWDLNIDELTYSILALSSNRYDVQKGLDKLISRRSEDGSWNNRVYDTSLAIIALNQNGKDVSNSVNWLLQQQIKAQSQGTWLVEIRTEQSGSCSVALRDQNPITFQVNKSGVSCDIDGNGDGFGSWIDLERCGGFSLDKTEEVLINCNNLGNADIYLIYNLGNDYYILDEKFNTNSANLLLQNAYFGDFESTAYASWALKTIGRSDDISSISYLRSNARQGNVIDRAFLYILTNDKVYSGWLSKKQNNFTGSWDGNVFNTALSVLSLGKNSASGTKGVVWLKGEQNVNNNSGRYGSWNNDIKDTSFVVWSAFSDGIVSTPSNNTIFNNNTNFNFSSSGVCGNKIADPDEQCDARYASNGDLIEGDDRRCGPGEKCAKPGEINECTCVSLVPIQEKPCTTNNDCGSSRQYCDHDTLTCKDKECVDDEGCNIDEVCNLETFKCEVSGSREKCPKDGCELGYECVSDKCVGIKNFCTTNDDCSNGKECDTDINRCVEKKSGFPWWVITLVVLAIAGLVILYALKKRAPKKKNGPQSPFDKGQKPLMRPAFRTEPDNSSRKESVQRRDIYDERIESELDSSIRRAKELLGKK